VPPPVDDRRGRIAADTGGTFTDLVMIDSTGCLTVRKILSTPPDYAQGIVAGTRQLLELNALDAHSVDQVVHGTTVATNTILEHKGARTALITTKGFRDVLELRRLSMPVLYDLTYVKPTPLVPRDLRFEVDERLGATGTVCQPLVEAEVQILIERLRDADVESVAVALLHSYANSAHEQAIEDLLRAADAGWDISRSSEILPQIEEYKRTSTATINAYIKPVVRRYLASLERELAEMGLDCPILVMQSNGGVMTARQAQARPVTIVESGPAAGVVAAATLSRLIGEDDVITFDMGGTTAKAAMIEDGAVSRTLEYEIGAGLTSGTLLDLGRGYLLGVPAIQVAEVGAGGGSLAWIDAGGVMQVGPESAGASPGPVCYGNGGDRPTVTDANMVLGYLNPRSLAGGGIEVDLQRCQDVFARSVAQPLGFGLEEAALGVHRIANANMQKAIRAVTVERGRDPSRYSMLAFGGNGPVHGATLADALKIERVIVPPAAGLFSALGLLFADLTFESVRSVLEDLETLDWQALESTVAELRGGTTGELLAQRSTAGGIRVRVAADMRYRGQNHELQIPIADEDDRLVDLAELRRRFGDEYTLQYGHRLDDTEIEIVNLRAIARQIGASTQQWPRTDGGEPPPERSRQAYFADTGFVSTSVIARANLRGAGRGGPLIIEDYDTTTVVPPRWNAELDDYSNIVLTAERAT
jgi:N-methylhydantoinase A